MSKKVIALLLSVLMVALCFSLVGCGGKDANDSDLAPTQDEATSDLAPTEDEATSDLDPTEDAKDSDLAYIKEKGTLLIGITDFEPMDYQEKGSEEWIGFDADLARAFAASIGVKAEFVVIEWDSKVMELDGKSIDCVWNGMTITDEVKVAMSVSNPYFNNAQVVIVPADKAQQYQTAEACKGLNFAVENGSAGQKMAEENNFTFTPVLDQATALQEVAAGTSDAAIVDFLMAAAMVGEGTGYANLTYTAKLNSEEYGVGFRKGSDVVDQFNTFLTESIQNGTVRDTAEKYGLQDALIG